MAWTAFAVIGLAILIMSSGFQLYDQVISMLALIVISNAIFWGSAINEIKKVSARKEEERKESEG